MIEISYISPHLMLHHRDGRASLEHMIGEDPQTLESVLTTLDQYAAVDPTTLPAAQLTEEVTQLCQLRSRVEGLLASRVGVWDAEMVWALDGATSGPAWLRAHADIDGAAGLVKRARKLRDLAPLTAAALADGSLSFEKAAAIVAPVTNDLAPAFATSEAAIVEAAKDVTLQETKSLVGAWRAIAENDLPVDVWERQLNKRFHQLWDNPDGTVEGRYRLDPVAGPVF